MRVDVEGAMHRALGVACMGPHGLDPARNVDFARFQLERGTKTSFSSAEDASLTMTLQSTAPSSTWRPRVARTWPGPAQAASARLSGGNVQGRRSEYGAEQMPWSVKMSCSCPRRGRQDGSMRAPAPGFRRRPAGASNRLAQLMRAVGARGGRHRRASRSSVRPYCGGGGHALSGRPARSPADQLATNAGDGSSGSV